MLSTLSAFFRKDSEAQLWIETKIDCPRFIADFWSTVFWTKSLGNLDGLWSPSAQRSLEQSSSPDHNISLTIERRILTRKSKKETIRRIIRMFHKKILRNMQSYRSLSNSSKILQVYLTRSKSRIFLIECFIGLITSSTNFSSILH